jgi:acyl-coenzyme A synthetase/AMP-(fatty) acid ligase
MDGQVKLRGLRIELGEIEASVYALGEIESCAAIYDAAADQIVLFYQSQSVDIPVISETLRNRLPKYMLPSKVIRLEHMQYNRSGKIDRNGLKLKYETEYKKDRDQSFLQTHHPFRHHVSAL